MLRFKPTTTHAGVMAAFLVAGSASAWAAEAPSIALDPLSISIGDYVVSPTASVNINTPLGSAYTGDITSHQIQVPRFKADFLLGHSQGFALDYYGFYRSYADNFSNTFSAGNANLNLNANTTANVGIDVANVSYKWWFGEGADVFGVGLGAAYYRISLGVDATGTSNVDPTIGTANASYRADAVAPLIQLGWRHAFSPDTRMYVDLSGVEKTGGNSNGHIYNAAIGAEWYFAKYLGVGAEYSATRVHINTDDTNGNLDLKLDGPTIFLKARF